MCAWGACTALQLALRLVRNAFYWFDASVRWTIQTEADVHSQSVMINRSIENSSVQLLEYSSTSNNRRHAL
jgi:hypothetical protein